MKVSYFDIFFIFPNSNISGEFSSIGILQFPRLCGILLSQRCARFVYAYFTKFVEEVAYCPNQYKLDAQSFVSRHVISLAAARKMQQNRDLIWIFFAFCSPYSDTPVYRHHEREFLILYM